MPASRYNEASKQEQVVTTESGPAMLTPAQVKAVYSRKPAKAIKGKALTRDGWEPIEKITDYNLGGFQGKVGSIRRNRKGATRRLPNGKRRDYRPYMEGKEVIAYKLAK